MAPFFDLAKIPNIFFLPFYTIFIEVFIYFIDNNHTQG